MVMRPQVITKTNVLTSFISPAGARVGAMIGSAQWGESNKVTLVSSMNEFINMFGDDITGTSLTLVKGADLFFRNGGTLKVIRIVDGTEAKADITLVNGATEMIDIDAVYTGTYGNNITIEVVANDSNMDVSITDGVVRELFTNFGAGYPKNSEIVTAINNGSSLVTAAVKTGQEDTLVAVTSSVQLTGGANGSDALSDTNYTDALDNLLLTEEYNFLMIPNKTVNAFHSTVVGKLNSRDVNEKRYSRYVTGITLDENIATALARTASGKRITRLAPSIKYTNRNDGATLNLDGSYLACAYAGVLCQLDLSIAGTHEDVNVNGLIINTTSGKEYYTKIEQEQLLEGGIAPVSLIGNNIQMVRGITSFGDNTSIYTDEVVVDILDFVTNQCENYLNSTLGKPNTKENRAIYSSRLDALLTNLRNQGIVQEFQDSQVLQGSSPDTIIVEISIKPTYNTNFVMLTINVN